MPTLRKKLLSRKVAELKGYLDAASVNFPVG